MTNAMTAAAVAKAEGPGRKDRERSEAINYLQAWMSMRKAKEEAEAGGASTSVAGLWKFSKNTQAWLLRHLFSEDQIDEGSFRTLCLYLEGLKGSGRERVLAEAQAVIDKHGPDEGEELTAAAREAAAPAAAAEVEALDETFADDEPAQVAPSGYNSDSSEEGEESSGETSAQDNVQGGTKIAEESPQEVTSTVEAGEGVDSGSSSGSSSDSSSDSDEDAKEDKEAVGDKGAVVEAVTPAGKKRRKARSALTGNSKAEVKARTAMVAYERALQLAELLS
eukprot:jgi/Undpi1/12080/HiC_scaffold_4.g01778.m1